MIVRDIHLTGVTWDRWSIHGRVGTTHGRQASCRPGSALTPIAWITWTGCAGLAVCLPVVRARGGLAAGRWPV